MKKSIHQILKRLWAKNLEATLLFVDFSKTFDSIYGGKMEHIQFVYGFHKETVASMMKLYKNRKAIVCSPDGDTDFFNIIAGVLQGYILVPYMLMIYLDTININRSNERKWSFTKKGNCPVSWGCRIHRPLLCRGIRSIQQVSWIWHQAIWWWGSNNAGPLGNAEDPFIAIAPRSTLAQSGSTWSGPIYGSNRTKLCIYAKLNCLK